MNAERGEQAQRDQEAGAALGQTRDDRVGAAGPEADRFEELGGAGEARPSEPAEELLGAVADEKCANDKAQEEDSEVHEVSVHCRGAQEPIPRSVMRDRGNSMSAPRAHTPRAPDRSGRDGCASAYPIKPCQRVPLA